MPRERVRRRARSGCSNTARFLWRGHLLEKEVEHGLWALDEAVIWQARLEDRCLGNVAAAPKGRLDN